MPSQFQSCTLRHLSDHLNICYEAVVVGIYRVRVDTLLPFVSIPRSQDVIEASDACFVLVPRHSLMELLDFAFKGTSA